MIHQRGAMLLAILTVGPAWAVYPPPIRDDGKFFKSATIEAANKKARELYAKYNRDVVVETLHALTPQQEKQREEEGNQTFFAKLAHNRAQELGLNGVLILISRKPTYLQVHVSSLSGMAPLSNAERDGVRDRLRSKFKEGDFDGGLQAAFESIESALKKPRGPLNPKPVK